MTRAPAATTAMRGLPFTRSYSYEEIGDVSRGARLSFDRFDRLAVIHRGAYVVLNDATWMDLAERNGNDRSMLNVAPGPDGQWYYGTLGSWGVAEVTPQGKLRQQSLLPVDVPKWVNTTSLTDVVPIARGICFGGWNGVVYFEPATRRSTYFAVPEVSRLFTVAGRVFVSSHRLGLQMIDLASGALQPVPNTVEDGGAIDPVTTLDPDHVLVGTAAGRLLVFDGVTLTPWNVAVDCGPANRVTALCHLLEGGVAVAVSGRGLYIVGASGEISYALTAPEYQRVTDLATREPGVVWVATETGVEKILYAAPVTMFGQRLGLPISWPQVVQWRGELIVASGGRLYRAVGGANGAPTHFEPIRTRLTQQIWGLAAQGPHLLIGTADGVFARDDDGEYRLVAAIGVSRLVLADAELCYAIGGEQIAVLRWSGGQWRECAPRIPGVGYPSVVHAAGRSAWIELGPNRVARVSLHGGELRSRVFENFAWTEPHWVNLGLIGSTVVMSGPIGQREYFDEVSESLTAAPEIDRLLAGAPFSVGRVREDAAGTLWATHERGILTIKRGATGPEYDATTYDLIDDHTPFIHLLPDGDVWVSSGLSLYHVDRPTGPPPRRDAMPVVVALVDGRTNVEQPNPFADGTGVLRLPYGQNSLGLRFFAGTYNYPRTPTYEFTLRRDAEWTSIGSGSQLNFPGLREGGYRLLVRLVDAHGPAVRALAVNLEILAPWYRTWYAVLAYAALGALLVVAVARWSMHRAHARNLELERLVECRTDELKSTMERLNEETRHAATLAERHRVAGEIHDSLQQGLSGLMLQLDATLKLGDLSEAIRSRLLVARNMVSFTRHEVQHAVWNLESPLLEDAELGTALRKLTSLISPGLAEFDVEVSGDAPALPPTIKHDLLRIAQEALTNAVRHAQARRVELRLAYEPGRVEMSIADNGCGFDPDAVLAHGLGHFGLRGLRSRARKIGGELEIESVPGQGTTIRVTVSTDEQRMPHHAFNAAI